MYQTKDQSSEIAGFYNTVNKLLNYFVVVQNNFFLNLKLEC